MNELLKRRRRLREFEVKCYVKQICEALKYLHTNKVIHRDLKISNLFLGHNMSLKIGDFGLAAKLCCEGERRRSVCGTPNYIAPEVLDEKLYDGHYFEVDIWSLGVVIFTLLYGKPPFQSNNDLK